MAISASYQAGPAAVRQQPTADQNPDRVFVRTVQISLKQPTYSAYGATARGNARINCTGEITSLVSGAGFGGTQSADPKRAAPCRAVPGVSRALRRSVRRLQIRQNARSCGPLQTHPRRAIFVDISISQRSAATAATTHSLLVGLKTLLRAAHHEEHCAVRDASVGRAA